MSGFSRTFSLLPDLLLQPDLQYDTLGTPPQATVDDASFEWGPRIDGPSAVAPQLLLILCDVEVRHLYAPAQRTEKCFELCQFLVAQLERLQLCVTFGTRRRVVVMREGVGQRRELPGLAERSAPPIAIMWVQPVVLMRTRTAIRTFTSVSSRFRRGSFRRRA